jgi:hypothetical protein
MRFTPKTEEEIQQDSLLPAGTYDFRVIAAEDKQSSAGNDMIVLTLAVYRPDGNGFYQVTDYLLEKLAFKLRHFCEETGLINRYESGALEASDLVDREGRVQIKIDPERTDKATGKVYAPKNSVKDYGGKGAGAGAGAGTGAPSSAPVADDDGDAVPW